MGDSLPLASDPAGLAETPVSAAAPGGLSQLGVSLLIWAQVTMSGSWDRAPGQAPSSVGSLLGILALPLPLPLVHMLCLSLK